MLAATDLYKTLAQADSQYARIKVELGCFGIKQAATDEVKATFDEDTVSSCSVEHTLGDSGKFTIGAAEPCECTLQLFTDDAKAASGYIADYDYRVSYGYEADGVVEWLVMGLFATDSSLISRSGMSTTITMYDCLYWLSEATYTPGNLTRGFSMTVSSMLSAVLEDAGLTLAEDSTSLVPESLSLKRYRPRQGSLRSVLGDVAAAMFCSVSAYDGQVHLHRMGSFGDAVAINPDDFLSVPSYDLTSSSVSLLSSTVTETNEYESTDESSIVAPNCELLLCDNEKVSLFGATAKQKKANTYYVLRIYRPSGTNRNLCCIGDTDSPKELKYATATAKGGKLKGKTLSKVYDAGCMLGTYVTSGVTAIGKNVFSLDRYGKKFYLNGSDTKWFPAYSETVSGETKSYDGTFGDAANEASLTLRGPAFSDESNRQKDWSEISEWRGDDITHNIVWDGSEATYGWDEAGDASEHSGISLSLDSDVWADGGTVNTLKSDSALAEIAADFESMAALAALPYSYAGSSTQLHGRNYIGVGDLLEVTDAYGDSYSVPVLKAVYDYAGGITTTVSCEALDSDVSVSDYSAVVPSEYVPETQEEEVEWTHKVVASKPTTFSDNTIYFVTG